MGIACYISYGPIQKGQYNPAKKEAPIHIKSIVKEKMDTGLVFMVGNVAPANAKHDRQTYYKQSDPYMTLCFEFAGATKLDFLCELLFESLKGM